MGAIARFLLALERLARRRGLKIEDAFKFAKQEFGEMTPLLKKQIENVFSKIFILLVFTQITFGAFTSGLDAGKIYQSWPLMNNYFFS